METIKRLSDGWTVKNETHGEYAAYVPGDITNDLYLCGKIPDPLFGVNFKELGFILNSEWEYTCVFSISESELSASRLELRFEGVDTFSEIFLNGERVGATDNMYLRYDFDVKRFAQSGDNVLSVKMQSPYKVYDSRKNEKYMSIFHPNRIYYRKPSCHFMWDWAPDFPGYGIYKPVYLVSGDYCNISDAEITCDVLGNATFITRLDDSFKNKPKGYSLCLRVSKHPNCDLKEYYELETEVCGQFVLQNVAVENAELWWPNGYGDANLYGYSIELKRGGKTVSSKSGKFGFRTVTIKEEPLDSESLSFVLNVNGTDIFCKGSNWVPASNMTGTITDSVYERLIKAANEANYNLLRVWGGGIYESEKFYDLCDELGIMVWQDFMFACSDLPDDDSQFRKTVYKEAEQQLIRLRNRPCIAVWCGGNERRKFLDCKGPQYGEYIWEVLLRGLHAKLTRNSAYVPNSPHSRTDIDMDYSSGDLHTSCYDPALIDDRIPFFREYLAKNKSPFTTECAILGPCRIRSLKKFIPAEKLWPVNEVWHEHFMLNPYACVPEETFITKEFRLSEALFGKTETLPEFVKKAMSVHSEIMRSEIEYARASERCNGILNWMYNDIWGCGTWSVIDFYGEKKPVFYAQKAAFKPAHVFFWFDGEKINLSVANDLRCDLRLSLEYGQSCICGKSYGKNKKQITVKANSVYTLRGISVDKSVKNGYLRAQIEGDGVWDKSLYFYDLWKNLTFKTDLTVCAEQQSENAVILKIKANEFARSVFIDLPFGEIVLDDNYFDMEKGDERVVTVKADFPINKSDITVKTFADEWSE